MNFEVAKLRESGFPEDAELAEKAEKVVELLVKELKPVLRYIAIPFLVKKTNVSPPSSFRAIEIICFKRYPAEELEYLFLSEDGIFFTAKEIKASQYSHEKDYYQPTATGENDILSTWRAIPFNEFTASLEEALRQAKEKREKHLASIAERSARLDKIMEILKS